MNAFLVTCWFICMNIDAIINHFLFKKGIFFPLFLGQNNFFITSMSQNSSPFKIHIQQYFKMNCSLTT